jgi:hypothetical protein
MSRRVVSLILLRPPVKTWPDILYMNWELVQVQSGGLDLKSSILRPCINFLYFVANGCGRGVWIDLLNVEEFYI